MITVKELMGKYKISRKTVYNWIRKGLPVIKIGAVIRFDPEKVQAWIDKNNQKGE